MHRRTFLLTLAAVSVHSSNANAEPVCITDHVRQWQSGPNPKQHIIVVENIDENGKFAGPLARIVETRFQNFKIPYTCLISFEFREEDHKPWLPPDSGTTPAWLIFESRQFDLIDRAADIHHNIWRKRQNLQQTSMKQWNQENQIRRARLDHITLTFEVP
jgi:hypothetical protein